MALTRASEDRPTPKEVYNYRIYLLTSLVCLGSWMFGYNNGVIAGLLVLPSFHHDFHLPPLGTTSYNNITANIVSLLQIGGLVGVLATFPLMKYWGRRVALISAAGIYFLGAALQTFSYGKLPMMYISRLISGLGIGSVTVTIPLYIAELSPPAIRGSLVGMYEIHNQLSSLMGYWCNYIVNQYIPSTSTKQWQIPLAIQMVPSALLFLSAIFILPESPRFLVKADKKTQARKVLAYIRHLSIEHEYLNAEIEEIEQAILMQERSRIPMPGMKGRFALVRELWWKGNRERVLIGVALMAGQNMTGINGINFYTPMIFKSIGFDGTKIVLLASGMYALVKTLATILSLQFFIDRTGRRKLLLISSLGTALALWYIGSFVTAANIDLTKPQKKTIAGWVAIVCVYIYAAFFSVAWNGVVWVYCAEIFPTRIKELAVCLTTSSQWITQFAIARATPSMISQWKGGFFFFFAASITVMGVLVWWLVPETKGRSLESMDLVFGCAYGEGTGLGGVVGKGEGKDGKDDLEMGEKVEGGNSDEKVSNADEILRVGRAVEV